MMNVYMSLNMFCITRLLKSWKHVPKSLRAVFEKLEVMLKPMSNFSGYREKLAQAPMPCIPYVGIVTKDLVALEELPTYETDDDDDSTTSASHDTTADGKSPTEPILNVFKMTQVSKVLHSFFKRQKAAYGFIENDDIIYELLHPEGADGQGIIPDSDLVMISEQVECDAPSRSGSRVLITDSAASTPSSHRVSLAADSEFSSPNGSSRGSMMLGLQHDESLTLLIQECAFALHSLYHSAIDDDEGAKDLESVTLLVDTLQCLTCLQSSRNDRQIPTSIPLLSFIKRICKITSKLFDHPSVPTSPAKSTCKTTVDPALHVLAVPSNLAAIIFAVIHLTCHDTAATSCALNSVAKCVSDFLFRFSGFRSVSSRHPFATSAVSLWSSLNQRTFLNRLDENGGRVFLKITVSAEGIAPSPIETDEVLATSTLPRLRSCTFFRFLFLMLEIIDIDPTEYIVAPLLDLLRATVTSGQPGVHTINMVCPVASSQVNHVALARLSQKPIPSWTVDDVYEWGLSLPSSDSESCGSIFARNEITGELLLELSADDLTSMGLQSAQVKAVMAGLSTLQRKAPSSSLEASTSSSDGSGRASDCSCCFFIHHPAPLRKLHTFLCLLLTLPFPAANTVKIPIVDPAGNTVEVAIDPTKVTQYEQFTDEIKRVSGLNLSDSQVMIKLKYEDSEGDSLQLSARRFEEHLGYIAEDVHRGSKSRIVMVQTATALSEAITKADANEHVPMVVTSGDSYAVRHINPAATAMLGLALSKLKGVQVDILLVKPTSFYLDMMGSHQLPTETTLLAANGVQNIRLSVERFDASKNVCIWEFAPVTNSSANATIMDKAHGGRKLAIGTCKETLASSPRPAFVVVNNGIVSLNRSATQLLGFDLVDVYGKSPGVLAPSFSKEAETQIAKSVTENAPGEEEESSSMLFQKKDGSLVVGSLTTVAMENVDDACAAAKYCVGCINVSST
jgi:hypothetical protein